MGIPLESDHTPPIGERLAGRLGQLRQDRGWSLDTLARESGISRATLSRMENAEVSPTAENLGRLCAAYGLTMTRLLSMVEDGFTARISANDRMEWTDPATGFRRQSVSPPSPALTAEVVECQIPAGATLNYPAPSRPGLEHHLVLLEGQLTLTVDGVTHTLGPDDCLRYCLFGASSFQSGTGARYLLVLV